MTPGGHARAGDVAIVGAGPAGCWAAYGLARRGAHVTLIDGSHPREKPCGGGVTGRALALVSGAIDGRAAALPYSHGAIPGLDTEYAHVAVPLGNGALVVAGRTEFDGALLDAASKAGATIVRSRALDVTRDARASPFRHRLERIYARTIIGADGANSLVRRKLARPFERTEFSIATGYFVHGVTSQKNLLELVDDPPGYIWSFPRPTHLAVGICAQADAGTRAGVLRARGGLVDRRCPGRRGNARAVSWPSRRCRPGGFENLSPCGPGWFLVGDAAGLVDPVTREGIYFALRSGEWAAEAADKPRRICPLQGAHPG